MGESRILRERRLSPALSLGLLAILWAGARASAQPAAEDDLVYSKPGAGIYLQKGDTSERIVLRMGASLAPRFSPDGKRLILDSARGGKAGIWICEADGTNLHRICDGDQGEWLPEGDGFIFRRDGTILARQLNSMGTEQVVSPAGWTDCLYPACGPGGMVFFVRGNQLFLVDPKTGGAKELLDADIESAPKCSPDGKLLAYQDGAHIHLLDLQSGRKSQLTSWGGVQSWPTWSLDGKSVGYCESPGSGGPCDVHAIAIPAQGSDLQLADVAAAKPVSVRILCRGVDLEADWRGNGSPDAETADLQEAHLEVWAQSSEQPVGLASVPSTKEGWKPLGEVYERTPAQKAILVENNWESVLLAPEQGSLALFPSAQSGLVKPVTIALAVGKGAGSCAVVSNNPEEFVCEVSLKDAAGKTAKALCKVSRGMPCIQLTPESDGCEFFISNDARCVLIPDRFSNDILVDPAKYSEAEILLPSSPFVLAPSTDAGNSIVLITPAAKQTLSLVKNGSGCSIRAVPAGEAMFVCLMAAKSFSSGLPTDIEAKEAWVKWSQPFPARWRASLFGKQNSSTMIGGDNLSGRGVGVPLEGAAGPAGVGVVYLYGRSNGGTPLTVLTPEDLVQDALGVRMADRLLDTQGILGYRTTEDHFPIRELLAPSRSVYRAGQTNGFAWRKYNRPRMDFSPVLELLGGGDIGATRLSKTSGVETQVDHFSLDILHMLAGLDERMKEYDGFLSELQVRCEALRTEDAPAAELLDRIHAEMDELAGARKRIAMTDLANVQAAFKKVGALVGSEKMLGETDEFTQFARVSQTALAERQSALKECREFAQAIRDQAGLAVIENPQTKAAAEQVRTLTQKILRDRYYLEDDWRSEL